MSEALNEIGLTDMKAPDRRKLNQLAESYKL